MPIYEFACEKCRSQFEVLVRRPSEKVACPSCGARKVRRRFSVFGIGGGASKDGGSSGAASKSSCSRGSCSGCKGCR